MPALLPCLLALLQTPDEPPASSPYEVQGRGPRSSFEDREVTVEGVVTAYSSDGRRLWIQAERGDGDPWTSDALAVEVDDWDHSPSTGDLVLLRAVVQEKAFDDGLPVTTLVRPCHCTVLATGRPLPAALPLDDAPTESLEDSLRWWEAREGMRAEVPGAVAVAATDRYGEFAVLASAAAREGSGFCPDTGVIRLRPLAEGDVDYNPERILAVGSTASCRRSPTVRVGDRFERLVGVVDYTYSNYKLRITELVHGSGPPAVPGRRSGPEGDTVITSFNVENLFDLEDDPDKDDESSTPRIAGLGRKLQKLTIALDQEMRRPDLLILQEVENQAVLDAWAATIEASTGVEYLGTCRGSSDGRGIENAFLWRRDRVRLVEAFLLDTLAVRAAFGPASRSPGREPLVGIFEVDGRRITVVGNHLKSKWGDDALYGGHRPPRRSSEIARHAQSLALREWVQQRLEEDPELLLLVAGDFNDFEFAEPGEGPHTLGILHGPPGPTALHDLLLLEVPQERFTYVYQGNAQILDHALASAALRRHVVAVDVLHLNATQPEQDSRDARSARRCSDHDPLEIRLQLRTSDRRP